MATTMSTDKLPLRGRDHVGISLELDLVQEFLEQHRETKKECSECGESVMPGWENQSVPLLVWPTPTDRLVCFNCELLLTCTWFKQILDYMERYKDKDDGNIESLEV